LPIFPTPLSFGALATRFPFEFRTEVNHEETIESWGCPTVKMHDRSWSRFDTVPVIDGQTDGRTDGQTD